MNKTQKLFDRVSILIRTKDIKVLPDKVKDYGSVFSTDPIQNFPEIREWWMGLGFEETSKLLQDNRTQFRELFGKPSFHYRGEFYHSCWTIDLSLAQLLILTAKGKGTGYEIVCERLGQKIRKDKRTVILFLTWLLEQL